jgi:hypothetical protein
MKNQITHTRQEETPEAKARWFQSLTLNERAELLVTYTDLILEANPHIVERKLAKPVEGHIRVVSKP